MCSDIISHYDNCYSQLSSIQPVRRTLTGELDLLPVDLKGHIQFTESRLSASPAGRHLLMLRGLIQSSNITGGENFWRVSTPLSCVGALETVRCRIPRSAPGLSVSQTLLLIDGTTVKVTQGCDEPEVLRLLLFKCQGQLAHEGKLFA